MHLFPMLAARNAAQASGQEQAARKKRPSG
jgi:hypothetical protein